MNPLPRLVPTIALLVDRLFRVHRDPSGNEYSLRQVSLAASGEVGPTNIHNLRTGKNRNPSHRTLLALALFFGEEPNYFFAELWDLCAPQYWQVWQDYQAEHPEVFTDAFRDQHPEMFSA